MGEPRAGVSAQSVWVNADRSRSSSESGEVIGLPRTGAKGCGSCGRARRRAIQEAASDSHVDEMKKSRRVTSRGNGGFIDTQSGKEG